MLDTDTTTIYGARLVRTMNPAQPTATHVAVRGGRVLAVGTRDELDAWGPASYDGRFEDAVLLPGFVEGHSHLMTGAFWQFAYCGYFATVDPDGRTWQGITSLADIIGVLSEYGRSHEGPIIGWGLDPIYFDDLRITRDMLDQVSATRPVAVIHASGHVVNTNSAALELAGFLRAGVDHPAFPLGDDGVPRGELRGPDGMLPVLGALGVNPLDFLADDAAIWGFGRLAARVGVTTATDLGASIAHEDAIGPLRRATADPAFPLRVVLLVNQMGMTAEAAVDMAQRLRPLSTDMLRMGFVKIHLDGSIQGFTARVGWPGYYNGAPNGLWYNPPELVKDVYVRALRAGLTVHAHTNGDEATELALDMIEAALHEVPRADHRCTLQHAQLATAAQFRRMRALGVGVNLFANHTFYWGDQHRTLTVGPERAERMNACASALAQGVPIAIHSDSPVTPMNPLFSAWCAVNRITASGRTQGEHERISVAEALHAVTLGPAYSLHLDHEVGSIECGKRADFCVLEEDPMSVDPMGLRDIRVLGTVQGGRVFEAG